MQITRVDAEYAYGQCTADIGEWGDNHPTLAGQPRVCRNTVKFYTDGSETVCPNCGVAYVCSGASAQRIGQTEYVTADAEGVPDDDDLGFISYD